MSLTNSLIQFDPIVTGSSTDLGPSVIAYYDRLSTSIDSNSNSSDSVYLSTATLHSEPLPTHPNTSLKSESTERLPVAIPPINAATSTPTKHRNFRVLSHNVQRMISHTNVTVDEINDIEQFGTPTAISTPSLKPTSKRQPTIIGSKQIKHPPIHLPLSKNICKLTQAQGNELVDAFDAIIGDLPDDVKTPTNLTDSSIHDPNRTPTNKTHSFLFENGYRDRAKPLPHASALTSIDERKVPKSTKIRKIAERLQTARSNNAAVSLEKIGNKMVKKSSSTGGANESDSSDDQFEDCIAEASNVYVNVPKTSQIVRANNGTTDVKVDDDAKSPNADNNVSAMTGSDVTMEKEPTEAPVTISEHSPRTSPSAKPKKLIFAVDTADGKPTTTTVHPQQLVIPDLARLKHRPLSASSICSTSSTSSSGSERLAGKHNVSYLASVESLADESELANSGLTLCERACMEIIDSEKSYVDDLGQVIKGYLADWKEGACLRTDELRVLFSNIEKVYAFNSVLLEQLVAAGSDPIGIAKCFVELKDRFDVYTTYW